MVLGWLWFWPCLWPLSGIFLLQAPVSCGAETRKGEWRRKNSHGLLRGCSIRQHKWQRLKQTFTPAGGRAVLRTSKSVSGALSTIGGVVAGVQVLVVAGVLAPSLTDLTLECQRQDRSGHTGSARPRTAVPSLFRQAPGRCRQNAHH